MRHLTGKVNHTDFQIAKEFLMERTDIAATPKHVRQLVRCLKGFRQCVIKQQRREIKMKQIKRKLKIKEMKKMKNMKQKEKQAQKKRQQKKDQAKAMKSLYEYEWVINTLLLWFQDTGLQYSLQRWRVLTLLKMCGVKHVVPALVAQKLNGILNIQSNKHL